MLLLKLKEDCFLGSGSPLSHSTCEFVLQYLFNSASDAEVNLLITRPLFKETDIEKLPKRTRDALIQGAKKRKANESTR